MAPTYTSVSPGVTSRLGWRGAQITATSRPTTTDVSNWLEEAEAEALGAIKAGGGPSSFASGSQGAKIIRARIENYVAGLTRIAHAAAGGEGDNDDGRDLKSDWKEWLRDLRSDSAWMLATLDSSGDEGDAATVLRSHATDDALSLNDRELIPNFTIEKGVDGGNF